MALQRGDAFPEFRYGLILCRYERTELNRTACVLVGVQAHVHPTVLPLEPQRSALNPLLTAFTAYLGHPPPHQHPADVRTRVHLTSSVTLVRVEFVKSVSVQVEGQSPSADLDHCVATVRSLLNFGAPSYISAGFEASGG